VKILLWYWGRRGGGARFTQGLAGALAPHCDLMLSLSRNSELFADTARLAPGFHIDTYRDLPSAARAVTNIPALRQEFAAYIKSAGVDVVISGMHHMWSAFFVGPIKAAGAKLIVTMHDAAPHPGDPALGWDFMIRKQLKAADGVMALSDHVADTLSVRYGVLRGDIGVIPHPAFDFGAAPAARRFPKGRPFRLLFFGRIKPYKGLDLLLDAARLLEPHHDIALTIAGQGDLKPYAQKLAALRSVKTINRWIEESEVGALLAGHDLLLTSYSEASQSGVIPSANAVGLPVVASRAGGLREQVADGVTGVLAKDDSAQAFADAVARLVADPALYEGCSAGALNAAHEKFGWPSLAAAYLAMARALSVKSAS
jgi:glycosyltransferase involved in cell wall biosynthesis